MFGHAFAIPVVLVLLGTCLYDMYRGVRVR